MKRLLTVAAILLTLGLVSSAEVSAQIPYGFIGNGNSQPYGVRYKTRTPTPPYFALNPPVYYGARYSRPYGISPFAALPVVTAPPSYHGRLRSQFEEGPQNTVVPSMGAPVCDDCTPFAQASANSMDVAQSTKMGAVRFNPFVSTGNQLVAK